MAQAIFRALLKRLVSPLASTSAKGARRGKMLNTASMPYWCTTSTPSPNTPAIPITGTLNCFATDATPSGALPPAVCESMRPSPVITSAAPCTACARWTAFNTISMPGLISALRNTAAAIPIPPAAPPPAIWQTLISVCCCKTRV